MAILRSPNELAAALDLALAEKDDRALIKIEWEASWTHRPCFHCDKDFGSDDRAFLWMGSDQALVMHQACLINWLPRVQKDAARIHLSNA